MGVDAFLFPGQGSQFVGMGREWHATSVAARDVFARADRAACDGLPGALSQLCFEGPAEVLNDTQVTQPALLVASVAALGALQEQTDARPSYVAGHSLGEFSALVAAGALPFEEALGLVCARGRLMKQAGEEQPGGMAAVIGLERAVLEEICAAASHACGEPVGVANDNCPGQLVISGGRQALAWAMNAAKERGAKRVLPLAVSVAAHSPLMAQAAAEFGRLLEGAPFQTPEVAFVSATTACAVTAPEEVRAALRRQLTSPVRWREAVGWMVEQGVTRFVEVGPKDVLTGLVRRIDPTVEVCHVDALLPN